MSDDDESEDGSEKPTKPPPIKRRTPSVPMVALNPTREIHRSKFGDPSRTSRLDDNTRDILILKLIARVERIDTEVGQLVTKLSDDVAVIKTAAEQQANELKMIKRQLLIVREMLVAVSDDASARSRSRS